jgi:acetyl esterase/lipase
MARMPTGEILEFVSPVDGLTHPVAVCETSGARAESRPLPLLLEVSPGALADLDGAIRLTETIAGMAEASGRECVVAYPTGRGPGSVYQDYGEVDVLEAIEFVAGRRPIDRDRISITGASMGGAATLYLASHYTDLFAAAAPFCGYSDYRLWEKPGGLTFFMRPWEEPSWQARSATLLAENLTRTPTWLIHGEWDRSVGGGVSVEQSRRLAARLEELGAPYRYTEVPRTGHDVREDPALLADAVAWLLDQRKDRNPSRVRFATGTLRHNRSAWVGIEQQEHSGQRSSVDATLDGGGLVVRTENVAALAVGPIEGTGSGRLSVDGDELGIVDLAAPVLLRRSTDGRWTTTHLDLALQKHHAQSGPIADLFHDGTLLVVGTIGTDEETFFNGWAAEDAVAYYQGRNGGVHRGGIMGRNTATLPVVRDVDLADPDRRGRNLLCYGTPASNGLLRRYADALPVAFFRDGIELAGRRFEDPFAAVIAVLPHPDHDARYVAVHGGLLPDAVTWGSHLDLGLLPDWLAYARGDLLDWGFFDNDWRIPADAP